MLRLAWRNITSTGKGRHPSRLPCHHGCVSSNEVVCVCGWVGGGGGGESSPTDRNLMEPLLQIRGRRRKEAEAGGRTRRAPPLSHLDVSMDNTSIRVCVKKPQDGCTIPQNLHSCFPWKNRVTSCQPRTEHYCSSLRIN
jgi:hypothetical protein